MKKSIKKLLLLSIITLGLSSISMANFTFQGYQFGTAPVLTAKPIEEENALKFEFASEKEEIAKKINTKLEKEFDKIKKNADAAKVEITANNSKFLSLVIVSSKINKETNKAEIAYKGLSFDVSNGNELTLDNILQDYKNTLKVPLINKVRQFGVTPTDKFNYANDISSFYLQEDMLFLIFDKGVATNDFDGILFIPFQLLGIREILK